MEKTSAIEDKDYTLHIKNPKYMIIVSAWTSMEVEISMDVNEAVENAIKQFPNYDIWLGNDNPEDNYRVYSAGWSMENYCVGVNMCTATRNLQNDYYEQQLEEEAENEGMVKSYIDSGFTSGVGSDFTCPQSGDLTKASSVDDSFTWEEYEEWVKMGKTTGNSDKKDHSKFIQQVKDNELSKDDIVKYLEENL